MNTIDRLKSSVLLGLMFLCLQAGCSGESADNRADSAPDSLTITLVAVDSTTALALLEEHHDVTSRSSAMGTFVTAIDSVEAGSSGFWVYSVNSGRPDIACDRYRLVPGDTLRWHFRPVQP